MNKGLKNDRIIYYKFQIKLKLSSIFGGVVMKEWIISENNKTKAKELASLCNIPTFLAMLLCAREIDTPEKIERFLSEDAELSDPLLIKDMDIACERIKKAVMSYEKICVYGDYDCDGVTATAILFSYFESVCANVMYYIPTREDDGYGLNKNAIDKLKSNGVSLIVTVDNGIAAIDEVDYANSLGMDVVITDHHKPLNILPKAIAIVDPHRADCNSPYKMYCGAGIALKVVAALEGGDFFTALENYSDLAALGTIADLVPVDGENRIIIKYGLKSLLVSDRVGLSSLFEKASINLDKLSAGTVAFSIAPRINASGRMSTAESALRLLLTEDSDEAEQLADKICEENNQRKNIETKIIEDIEKIISEHPEYLLDRVVVVDGDNWHYGVIGIASARMTERIGKPVIIISTENGESRGSGRSIKGFSLCDAIFECGDLLTKYGGHPMAVGFSLAKENIPELRKRINEYAKGCDEAIPSVNIECKLKPEAISISVAKQIALLEPFGFGNAKPVFALCNMSLDKITEIGGGKHLKLSMSRGQTRINVMNFSTTRDEFYYKEGDIIDIAVTLEENVYMGRESVSIITREIKLSANDNKALLTEQRKYEAFLRGETLDKKFLASNIPTREEFAVVYRYIRASKNDSYLPELLIHRLEINISLFKLLLILDIMKELYLTTMTCDGGIYYITINNVSGKVDINASKLLRRIKECADNGR